MSQITCCVCDKPLTGGTDTFSHISTPMCMECHFSLLNDEDPENCHGLVRCGTCRQGYEASRGCLKDVLGEDEIIYGTAELAIIEDAKET